MSRLAPLLLALISTPALAYIDPNVGSMLLQGLLAAAATIGVTAKLYWHKITALFHRKDSEAEAEPEQDS